MWVSVSKIIEAAFEEFGVLFRDKIQVTARAIGVERGVPPMPSSQINRVLSGPGIEQHLIVVARAAGPDGSGLAQVDEPLDDAPAVRPPVDVVAQCDDDSPPGGAGCFEEGSRAAEQPWMSPMAMVRGFMVVRIPRGSGMVP